MTERPRMLGALWHKRRVFSHYEAFVDLLELAATRRCSVLVGRQLVWLDRGQMTTSSRALSDRWCWSRRRVVDFLTLLEAEGEAVLEAVRTTKDATGTKVTLVAYEAYMRALEPNGEKATLTPDTEATYPKTWAKLSQAKSQVKSHPNALEGQGVTPIPEPTKKPPKKPYGVNPSPQGEIISASNPEGGPGGNSEADHKSTSHHPLSTVPFDVSRHGEGFVAFAVAVTSAANASQRDNGRIDRERYRPLVLEPRQKATLATLLEWWHAGVSAEFARRYVWTEGARFTPTPSRPQIASLAYLRSGLLTAWRERVPTAPAVTTLPDAPRKKGRPTPISDSPTLAAFLPPEEKP